MRRRKASGWMSDNGEYAFYLFNYKDGEIHGNWLEASDGSTVVRRELDYCDERSYDAEMDAFLDAPHESAPALLRKTGLAQIKLSNLKAGPMLLAARLFQFVVAATRIYLFMLIFFRRRL